MDTVSADCPHCGLPVIAGSGPFCCRGCAFAATLVGRREGGYEAASVLRLAVGGLLAMEVMTISLLFYTGSIGAGSAPLFRLLLLLFSAGSLSILGYPFLREALREAAAGSFGLHFLVSFGCLASFAASTAAVLRGSGALFFDTATMIPFLLTVGSLLEATARRRVVEGVREAERLLPVQVLMIAERGAPVEAPAADARPGSLVRVRPGETVPFDGHVLEGASAVRESLLTGEPFPRRVGPGDRVWGGAVNCDGGFVMRVDAVGSKLLLRHLGQMAATAALQGAPTLRLAERGARLLVPLTGTAALAAGVVHTAAEGPAQGVAAVLAVSVVACPCAFGIAAPLAAWTAMRRGAREGALVRSGRAMEMLGTLQRLFVDKTGTITSDLPEVGTVEAAPGGDPDRLLALAAAVETGSRHPLARGIVREAQRRRLPLPPLVDFSSCADGVVGAVVEDGGERVVAVRAAGSAALAVEVDGTPAGEIVLRLPLRPAAAPAMGRLKRLGVETVLLSGDCAEAARDGAREAGIGAVRAPCLPGEKLQAVRASQRDLPTGMLGDGINDAAALAAADVGIAMGDGTDLARVSAEVVLLDGRLELLPWLVELSRCCRRVMRQNLAWAAAYNSVAIAAAAGGRLHPLVAALLMLVSSLFVTINSLRPSRFPAPEKRHD